MTNSAQTPPSRPTPGAWLTRQMDQRQISARRFADAMAVTTQTVYAWQNDRTVINEMRVARLAEVLGISELEARRGLGYWTPGEQGSSKPAIDRAELLELRQQLVKILERIDEIQNR